MIPREKRFFKCDYCKLQRPNIYNAVRITKEYEERSPEANAFFDLFMDVFPELYADESVDKKDDPLVIIFICKQCIENKMNGNN